jgi:DNA-nicking Smr family endonuclease
MKKMPTCQRNKVPAARARPGETGAGRFHGHNPRLPPFASILLPLVSSPEKRYAYSTRRGVLLPPFLATAMCRKKLSSRQSKPAAKRRNKKTGQRPIRKLTASDDLSVLFSSDPENTPQSFADALASGIPAATLAEILTEKEELPTPAQSLQGAIRNSPPPQDRLDLHGCTAAEAETKTAGFLARACRNHLKTVLVITGKGLHSPEGSVLKDIIEARLKIMKNDGSILAYLWEKKDREKSGALLVYLP